MHPRARRLLGWFFILTFLFITPVIILSTAGYRYNFTKKRLERTGVLYVETVPSGAKIGLSGRTTEKTSPTRITRLLPGTYDIGLNKEGFRPWSKKVEIFSSQTTFLTDVALFRETLPILTNEAEIVRTAISPDARYVAYVAATDTGFELRVLDLRDGKDHLVSRSESLVDDADLRWSPDSRRLLIRLTGKKKENVALIWNASSPATVTDLATVIDAAPVQAFWNEDARGISYVLGGQLLSLDLRTMEIARLGPVSGVVAVAENAVFDARKTSEGPALFRRELRGETFEKLSALSAPDFTPLAAVGRRVIFISRASGKMLIINPSPAPDAPSAFEAQGRDGAWSADGRRFLYWNDFELHEYDAERDTDTLLTRVSTPILSAAWLRGANALVYATGSGLFALEARGGNDRVLTPLAEFTELNGFGLGRSGTSAVLSGRIGRQSGLWTLMLR